MRRSDAGALIEHWTRAGLMSPEQARRLRADLPAPPRRAGLVAEGLGYLGGALVAVAAGLVAGEFWAELGRVGRPVVVGAIALLLAGAGVMVPSSTGSAARLRAVLWSGACGAVLGTVLLADELAGWGAETALVVAAAGALLCAAVFWALSRHPLQHATAFAAGLLLAAAVVGLLPHPGVLPGLAVWAVGVAWGLAAWAGVVRPPLLGRWFGALAATGGAVAIAGVGWGSALAVATVLALVAAAVTIRDTVLLIVAAAGVLLILPAVVGLWFPGMVSAAMAVLTTGLVLVVAAVLQARRQSRGPGGGRSALRVVSRTALASGEDSRRAEGKRS
ncbi:DUF2157 domain-containing protein [Nucisporomicrobium flavum]|uniref:DUF2157 domain-containing protein n=1 Tax=Nucisporomicrobium flavum TaxID=2785915 RepID=UPI0018F53A30|nr:DUF2157 domain-containing protein [Nucisporomicrobium flavum]